MRPVLKKNDFHLGFSVILTFKSLEILIIDEDQQGGKKIMNPLYVPLIHLQELIGLKKKDLIFKIMKSIEYNSDMKKFILLFQNKPKNE